MYVNVLMFNLMVWWSWCGHRSICCLIRAIRTIKIHRFCIGFELPDNTVGIFSIILGYISLNTWSIKQKHRGKVAINILVYRFIDINKLIKTDCKSNKKSCLEWVILETSGTLVKPQNSLRCRDNEGRPVKENL